MGYTNVDNNESDFDKLQKALNEIIDKFGSLDNLLEAIGLANMPMAQRYGIFFGCIVFIVTITTVIGLLILGGSFQRIVEQSETGQATILSASEARKKRSLLLERLLDDKKRMIEQNYSNTNQTTTTTTELTNLNKMLMNVAPTNIPNEDDLDLLSTSTTTTAVEPVLVNANKNNNKDKQKTTTTNPAAASDASLSSSVPLFYKENYIEAYRVCQDRPGGSTLSGRPEARFEAYARGYAGCGTYIMNKSYRRSYGRIYESICCKDHAANDKYYQLFRTRPSDIIGKHTRLEALDNKRHLHDLFRITSGEAAFENNSYDPQEVWGFLPDGPFRNEKEMNNSFVFQRKYNEAGFGIIHNITDRLLGVILLVNDDPNNLSIQLEVPIMPPKLEGSQQQMEACFLLMDRLFAYGYRRIQIAIDSQDNEKRKLCTRLGCTLEGVLHRHMIIKDASRDSNIYSMLNSDWTRGARASLFRKLYGIAACKADLGNEKREAEIEEQSRVLQEKKEIALLLLQQQQQVVDVDEKENKKKL